MNKNCKQCQKPLSNPYRKNATGLCFKCCMTGSSNPSYRNGKPKCVDCGKILTVYRRKRCRKCWTKFYKKENCYQWKGGKRKCLKCNILVKNFYAKYCSKHRGIATRKEKNYHWLPRLKCLDCGKELSGDSTRRKAQYCYKCVFKGERSGNWEGGITPINTKVRNSLKYALWRTKCFKRDNYTCQSCSYRGKGLQVDHIKPFCLFPRLRFTIKNGRTLCKDCHNLLGWRKRKASV
jgi:5-methylcytosine-specific restriction endonuclease McrA